MTYPTDDAGNVQVDFVWGNFPLQPNQDRGSNTLNYALDNHSIAQTGWSNYPAYIPNYDGTVETGGPDLAADAGLEAVVPDLRGLQYQAAEDVLAAVGLTANVVWGTPVITAFANVGKTATLTLDDVWGFKAGDIVSGAYTDGDGISGTFTDAKVKSVDGTTLVLTLPTAISPAVDITATLGSVLYVNYVLGNDTRYVLSQGDPAGVIDNVGTAVSIVVLQNND
jgi:hypothetical protein